MNHYKQFLALVLLCLGAAALAQDDSEPDSNADEETPPSEVRDEDEEFIPSREVPAAEEVVFPVDI